MQIIWTFKQACSKSSICSLCWQLLTHTYELVFCQLSFHMWQHHFSTFIFISHLIYYIKSLPKRWGFLYRKIRNLAHGFVATRTKSLLKSVMMVIINSFIVTEYPFESWERFLHDDCHSCHLQHTSEVTYYEQHCGCF